MRIFCIIFLYSIFLLAFAGNGNLLQNGAMKPDASGGLPGWLPLEKHSRYLIKDGMVGGVSSQGGRKQEFSYYQEIIFRNPDKSPVVFRGESCSENAGYGGDYCIYADIHYTDGSIRYAVKAKWRPGTHSREEAVMCYYPEKPVKKIVLTVLLRNSTGTAFFRNISLRRGDPGPLMEYCSLLSLAPLSKKRYRLDLGFFSPKTEFKGVIASRKGKILAEFKGKGKRFRKSFLLPNTDYILKLEMKKGDRVNRIERKIPAVKLPTGNGSVQVWCADSMKKISPLTKPEKNTAQQILLELAGNERESMQVIVSNGTTNDLQGITCDIAGLKNEKGILFPGTVEFRRVAYIPRIIPYATHPEQLPEQEYWLPDPLLPMKPFNVPGNGNAGIWLTFYAPAGTPAGTYTGTVTVKNKSGELGKIAVKLRVFGFDLPETFSYRSAFSLMDGFLDFYYPGNLRKFRRMAWDLMLDHRLNPDDITRTEMPEISDLLYARKRGMNSFNILHLVPKPKKKVLWTLWSDLSSYNEKLFQEFSERLDGYIRELEKHDLKKIGYFYGFDERRRDSFDALNRTRNFVKRRWNVPLLSTSTMFQESVKHPEDPQFRTTDWFCPLTNFYHKGHAERLRKAGHQVWTYTCCGPEYPYVNFANLEYPFLNARQIAWQVYVLGADGFLYWHVNNWHRKKAVYLNEDEIFQNLYLMDKFAMNATGDGVLLYPGKQAIYPSIRLANLRDGSEDYDYLILLQKVNPELAAKLAKQICPGRKNGIRDPRKLLEIRRKIAEYLEQQQR
ncbi:MAG: DUF4091 domain-containing protein [Lentisphaeria bacterium]|nr:DUF4091 domain-containing protein [Lentisphaeria bacterium]